MMLSKNKLVYLAKKICDAPRIGRKPNEQGIRLAIKDFREEVVKSILKEDFFTVGKSPIDEAILEKLSHPKYGPLVFKLKNQWRGKKKIGDCVRVRYNAKNKELADEIRKECLRRGAHPLLTMEDAQKVKEGILLPPIDSLSEFSNFSQGMLRDVDAIIYLEPDEDPALFSKIPSERMRIGLPSSELARKIWEETKTRAVLVGWPHPETAKYYNLSKNKFEKIFFDSLFYSFTSEFFDVLKKYRNAFNGFNKIHIVADDGTDLRFNLGKRHWMVCDGITSEDDLKTGDLYNNLPDGEICTAPIENSAEGFFFLPRLYVREHGTAENVMVEFRKGKLVNYSARKGKNHFKKYLASNNENSRIIGEFGIGCNKKASYTGGYILIDEKILGTVHIAIGDNKFIGGENNASGHFDMVKNLRDCHGCVYGDGKLIIKNGKLL